MGERGGCTGLGGTQTARGGRGSGNQKHRPSPEEGRGGRGTSESALSRGGGDALCPGADEGQEPAGALTWDPRQVVGVRILGAWPLSPTLGRGGQRGELACTPGPRRGCWARGPHLDPAGRPGARAARAGAGSPKGGLISFPRAAEVSAQCLSHLFKFYGAWLAAAGLRPGEEAGAGSGSLPRPRGGPSRQGAGQARGAQTLQGRPACEPPAPWFCGPLLQEGPGCPGPKGGVCLGAPGPAPFPDSWARRTSLVLLRGCWGAVWWGHCWKREKEQQRRIQSWGSSRVAKSTPLASVSFPWRRGGALKSRGRVKYTNLWSLMARPGTCLEMKGEE